MSEVHRRLWLTAERLSFQSSGLLDAKRYRQSDILALNSLGILMFLVVDQDTPEDLRKQAEEMVPFERNMAARARSEWIRVRQAPKLQGTTKSILDAELDEALEEVEFLMRTVAEETR